MNAIALWLLAALSLVGIWAWWFPRRHSEKQPNQWRRYRGVQALRDQRRADASGVIGRVKLVHR